ncbi:hypothetical protein AeMF1_017157 [Aphanomyces euteiches]|nr:hypothetical protein AeMF1_017157 [Aphanomyces euteiches]KAH9181581.1 hypothetical protein AeNC1_016443 [Aphanomyces euteiches]
MYVRKEIQAHPLQSVCPNPDKVKNMGIREENLLMNPGFVAAVMVDLRFQVLLQKEHKDIGMKQLLATYTNITSYSQECDIVGSSLSFEILDTNSSLDNEDNDTDILESIIQEAEAVEVVCQQGTGIQ